MTLISKIRGLGLLLAFGMRIAAQTAAPTGTPALPTYDAATVRLNNSATGDSGVWVERASLRTENVPMRELLELAFNVRRAQIFGVPAWAERTRFDINAKITDPDMEQLKKLTPEQHRLLVQRLMVDRFALKWHTETRVVPTYELVLAKGGAKLIEDPHCSEDDDSTSQNNTDLKATCVRMRTFSALLSNQIDRPVVDKTGLTAHYDFQLKWTPEEAPASADAGKDADSPPNLFTALQEQLGLKLQPGKDPVQVLVIDQLNPPTEN